MLQEISHLNLDQKIGLKKKRGSRGTYNANSDIKIKISMIRSF